MNGNHVTARTFLGKEIRRAREAKGLSRAAIGKALIVSKELVAAWESGRSVPRLEHVKGLRRMLEFAPDIVDRILEDLVTGEVSPEWTGKWLTIEARAGELHSFDFSTIPGLLQIDDYARAVLQHNKHSPIDVEEQVRERLERQKIFDRENPPMVVFIIDERALRLPVGGKKVMHDQFVRLIEISNLPNVIIRLVPLDTGYYIGLVGSFLLARFDGMEVAFQDGILTGHVIEDRDQVSTLSRIWQDISATALTQATSLELLKKAAEQWEA
jgi:transcriptional regulator with XRE-family HTH domain